MTRAFAILRVALAVLLLIVTLGLFASCDRGGGDGRTVVVYCSVDADVARPIFEEFTRQTGVRVEAVFDTEATKTTGLVNRLLGEKDRPRADVWWSSEPFGTIRLSKAGVLAKFEAAASVPAELRASDGTWAGFARRQRVLVYNTTLVKPEELPTQLAGLTDARWRGRVGMARPQFGTTRGQMAALLHAGGEEAFAAWCRGLKANDVRLFDGNASVVRAVARGEIALGLTDNDDVVSGKANAWPVEMVAISSQLLADAHDRATDQRSAGERSRFPESAMQVPCTAGLIKGGPNGAAGRQLLAFLISPDVDDRLTASVFQTFPTLPHDADAHAEPGTPRRDVHGRPWLPPSDLNLEAAAEHEARALSVCERELGK